MQKTEQIVKYIMKEIENGTIKKGQKLPSCREVAEKLQVNKITVNKAYQILEEKHYVYCVPRGGYYLVGMKEEEVISFDTVDFQTVRPDSSLIPYRTFTHAMNRAIDEHKKLLFNYESPLGLNALREILKDRFKQDGVYVKDSQIMITQGAQQGLYLALKTLFSNTLDCKLLVEIPTYNLLLDMAENLHITCIGINRKVDGIDLNVLEKIFKKENIKAFYIIPRHHNPTGYSLSETIKKKIVALCYKYQILLIEDDYLADLAGDKRNLPLHYYDTNNLTIYIRSFSKTFMPGIRLGAIVVPDNYCNFFIQQKRLMDINTSSIPQAALDYFIRSGMYDQHIKKVNACYKRKLQKAASILKQTNLAGLSIHIPKQGIFIWMTLPTSVSLQELEKELTQNKIQVSSSQDSYLIPATTDHLRLCISGVSEKSLISLNTIVEIIKEKAHS
jgi:DNA-binding transcriptional MocR family regulator